MLKFAFLILLVSAFFSCEKQTHKEVNQTVRPSIEGKVEEKFPISRLKFDIQLNPDSIKITHYATIWTSFGPFKLALYGKDAPLTVKNFVSLARSGYFNNTLIHRIAKNFLIQMGDGTTKFKSKKDEWGKGGKSIYGGFFPDEIKANSYIYNVGYTYGTVAMANSGPNKNLSQFFICLEEAEFLEKKYTIFGKVVEGIEVIETIAGQEIIPYKFDSLDGTPKKPIKIFKVTIAKNTNSKR
ncbi:MAG: peptidylprolyl isomerase [Ignavibacteria bacterium]|nr:peptidylprolyl isomerase [Ignavibacteria bacterium]